MAVKEGVVDLGDSEVQAPEQFEKSDVRRIKMKQNEVIRITILEETTVMRLRHFMKNKGYSRCLSYQGWCPACVASEKNSPDKVEGLKKASEVFGVNVFLYSTEKTDNDPAALKDNKLNGDIFLFVFGSEKFTAVRSIKKMYGSIIGIDLQITCTDEAFQKMTITAYPEPSWYAKKPKVAEYIAKKYSEHKYPVDKLLCKEINPKKMIELYGINPALLKTPECEKIMISYAETKNSKAEDDDSISLDDVDIQSGSIPKSGSLDVEDAKIVSESSKKSSESKTISSDSILDEL